MMAQCRAEAASYSSLGEAEIGRDGARECLKQDIIAIHFKCCLYSYYD